MKESSLNAVLNQQTDVPDYDRFWIQAPWVAGALRAGFDVVFFEDLDLAFPDFVFVDGAFFFEPFFAFFAWPCLVDPFWVLIFSLLFLG